MQETARSPRWRCLARQSRRTPALALPRAPSTSQQCRASAQRPRRRDKDNVRHVNLDTHPRPVSSPPTRPARRAQASRMRQHSTGECNVWHVNLDAHQHPVRRKPVRPASRPEFQHRDGTRPMNTTCDTSTSARICARPTESPFDQPAARELQHRDRIGPAATTCGRPTSTHGSARSAASNLDQHAAPELRHGEASAADYNLQHVNLGVGGRSDGREPLRRERRTRARRDWRQSAHFHRASAGRFSPTWSDSRAPARRDQRQRRQSCSRP
jgi:hypothetical protein